MIGTTTILGLLAETFIHPGSGRNEGAIDLPVAREAATGYPFIAGSGFKGALRDKARQKWPDVPMKDKDKQGRPKMGLSDEVKQYFGEQENAGGLLVSDARLLLLPVRSLSGAYKWVTCPHLLERLGRDLKRSTENGDATEIWKKIKKSEEKTFLGKKENDKPLFLEERSFTHAGDLPEGLIDNIRELIHHEETWQRLNQQLVIIHDNDFNWFARYGLAIQARNALDENKITKSGALWYEETLPPDTLMYALLSQRDQHDKTLSEVISLFNEKPYLQAGGNETVGQGWFAVTVRGGSNND